MKLLLSHWLLGHYVFSLQPAQVWVKWTHLLTSQWCYFQPLFLWHIMNSACLMAFWPFFAMMQIIFMFLPHGFAFYIIRFFFPSPFWITSLEKLCESYLHFPFPHWIFSCDLDSPHPQPTPGLVISQDQIICHQNHLVLRNTERSDNARGERLSSLIICSVLVLNQYELTASLFTRLLGNHGKEVRNFCKFSSRHPPKLCFIRGKPWC